LALWLERAEALWRQHGKNTMSLIERWDYNRAITTQLPISGYRVLYAASGTNPAATIVAGDARGIVEHKLYWAEFENIEEARYLAALLNSETTRVRGEKWQSMGQWGARDFDKSAFNLPIPSFNTSESSHRNLAAAAERAEQVASAVSLKEGEHFTRARKRIRDALRADGVAGEIDQLVGELLDSDSKRG
jgi:hypothetical protein